MELREAHVVAALDFHPAAADRGAFRFGGFDHGNTAFEIRARGFAHQF